ncbi:MAG: nitrogenase molybdenum-iron protein subunit beta [Candidatus Atelocyanobacterium thalassa]|jgi:nitrogenase molybdenum-iron protein beta chain
MAQNVNKIKDHVELFHQPEYKELFANKKQFEGMPTAEKVKEVAEWTKSWEYREKNFAREALTVNPAKGCQPLGALLAAVGFEGTLPFVHGSQGCVSYFRTHLTRHFKEPVSAVSSSMTENAAVFGGLSNMVDGLQNAYALYKPKMIAVCTTCMAEVIGDDLGSFIGNARVDGVIPAELPIPFAHTPSFVGSHVNGYDHMMKSILTTLGEGKKGEKNGKINFMPGFETYMGNLRELKKLIAALGVNGTILSDTEMYLDSPNLGEFSMYHEGTSLEDAADACNAEATISLQAYTTPKTLAYMGKKWGQKTCVHRPWGIKATDEFLMTLSQLTGNPIPKELEIERGRAVDAMTDTQAWLHGKTAAVFGDPDTVMGLLQFMLEMGIEPVHILVHNSNDNFEEEARDLLASSPYGQQATVWGYKDLWHLRSLLFTEPVDFMIGNSYGKYLERDTEIPLIRIGYPIFDRHHLHRYSTIGYGGAINLLNWIANGVLDALDRRTDIAGETDISFDLVR